MPLTPQDVQDVKFPFGKKGYSEDDVDAFLDQVEAELNRLLTENGELRARLASTAEALQRAEQVSAASRTDAARAPAPLPAPVPAPVTAPGPVASSGESENAALRTLLMAQRTSEQVVTEARAEANGLLAAARTGADDVERESQQRRAALEKHIEDLRAFEREYRTRLKAYLEAQLHDLDGKAAVPEVAAARAVAAVPSPGPVTAALPAAATSATAPAAAPQRQASPFTVPDRSSGEPAAGQGTGSGSNTDGGPAPQ